MIGAPLPSSMLLHPAASLRPLEAPQAPGRLGGADWADGLGSGPAATLRADVPAEQRGLGVQQHAERVLAALMG